MEKEQKILKEIWEKHKTQLKHLNIPHKKLIICFSGIPCTGKTYIAKILEDKYKAVRINTDDLRKIIHRIGKKYSPLLNEEHREEILKKYLLYLINNPIFFNDLIILDRGIDRLYELISLEAKIHGFNLFVIRIQSNKKAAIKGAIKKLGKPDKNFINNIDRWIKEYKEFGKTQNYDITIKNNLAKKPDMKKLFKALDKA